LIDANKLMELSVWSWKFITKNDEPVQTLQYINLHYTSVGNTNMYMNKNSFMWK
jgi:hypothetical protein